MAYCCRRLSVCTTVVCKQYLIVSMHSEDNCIPNLFFSKSFVVENLLSMFLLGLFPVTDYFISPCNTRKMCNKLFTINEIFERKDGVHEKNIPYHNMTF